MLWAGALRGFPSSSLSSNSASVSILGSLDASCGDCRGGFTLGSGRTAAGILSDDGGGSATVVIGTTIVVVRIGVDKSNFFCRREICTLYG